MDCSYCRGYQHTDINKVTTTKIEHGNIRFAAACTCECHAEQVAGEWTYDLNVAVTVDVKLAFMMFAEEKGLTQEDLDLGQYDMTDFCEWLTTELDEGTETVITGPGVITYRVDIDNFDSSDPEAVLRPGRLLNLVYPHLPTTIEDIFANPADLGMEPLFT